MNKKGVRKTGKGKNVGISIFFHIFFSDCNGRGKQRGRKKTPSWPHSSRSVSEFNDHEVDFFFHFYLSLPLFSVTPLPVHTCILTHVYTITVHLPGLDTLFHSGAALRMLTQKSDVCYKNDYKNGFVCLKCIYTIELGLCGSLQAHPTPVVASTNTFR